MPIDTQEIVDKLEKGGVPTLQAKVHAAVLAQVLDEQAKAILAHCSTKLDLAQTVASLATKQDLGEFKAEFRRELTEHGEKLEARIAANTKAELIKRGFTIVFAQTGLMALVIQLFDVL